MKSKLKFIYLIVIVVWGGSLFANDDLLEKEYNKTFAVSKDAKLSVTNKFGSVQLNTWNKSEIKINVLIRIENYSSKSKAEKLLNSIEIDMSGSRNNVTATTHIPKFKINNLKFSIDYHINLPAEAELDIKQAFGNISCSDKIEGETKLVVKHGSMQFETLSNLENYLEVSFGDIIVEKVNNASVVMKHGDVSIEEADKLNLKTAYGDVEIEKVNVLSQKSSFGDVEINYVKDFDLNSNYSQVEIDELVERLEADLDFGDMEINKLHKDFSSIRIDSDNAGVEIDVEDGAGFSVDVLTKFGKFYTYDDDSINREKISFNSYRYKGSVGKGNSGSKVIIEANFANIEIK